MKIKLNPGEILCPKCNGDRECEVGSKSEDPDGNEYIITAFCDVCHGTGKLDWIEQVVGKRSKNNMFTASFDEVFHGDFSITVKPYMEALAKQMADNVDREILKAMGVPCNLMKGK